MTVVANATFNLDLSEMVEEAFERCGSELRSGYDLRTARRSLNLLFADWANRGINLWTIEQGQSWGAKHSGRLDNLTYLGIYIRHNPQQVAASSPYSSMDKSSVWCYVRWYKQFYPTSRR